MKKRILIVGSKRTGELIADFLCGLYSVAVAHDGYDALLAMIEKHPDMIITDMTFEQFQGHYIGIDQAIAMDEKNLKVPLVFVSADAHDTVALERWKKVFHSVVMLAKPIDMFLMKKKIQAILDADNSTVMR